MKKKIFISKVFTMSLVMLLLNISGILYNIFIASKIGAEGIGMFHLVMSVYSLFITISVSGISLTATRLISDMPSSLSIKCADSVVIKCIKLILIPSSFAFFVLYFGAEFISQKILSNPDCAICLKLLAPSLLFCAVSSVINGYFTAFGRVGSISIGKIFSEGGIWISALCLLNIFTDQKSYMAVVIALCTGTFTECMWNIFMWRKNRNFLYCTSGVNYSDITRLCTPIAFGSYLRMGLVSLENLLIPAMLSVYGEKHSLASYGILKGMTLSVLMFPGVFVSAFNLLIVPEIARRRSKGYKNGIKYISALSLEYVLSFAFLVSAIFFKWHNEICASFFKEADAGLYLGCFFLFPVFVFCDSVVDSVLKGMDCQITSLKINIIDSLCRVISVFIFVPRFGMMAYIGIMYLSEIINLSFSIVKLKKVSQFKISLKKGIIVPLLSAVSSVLSAEFFSFAGVWASICMMCGFYIIFNCFYSKIIINNEV